MTEATHTYTYTFASPFGLIRLTANGGGLVGLTWLAAGDNEADKAPPDALTGQAAQEILDYAAGKRREFTVPVSLAGCSQAMRAWLQALRGVQYGETISYAGLASKAGHATNASRAAGSACAKNPIPLIYPCHRVLRKTGEVGNFGAIRELPSNHAKNLAIKTALIAHEQRYA